MHPIDGQEGNFLQANTLFGMENFGGSLQDNLSLRGLTSSDGSDFIGNGSWMLDMTFNSNGSAADEPSLGVPESSDPLPVSTPSDTTQPTLQRRLDDLLELCTPSEILNE
jgi:hypothetical protein